METGREVRRKTDSCHLRNMIEADPQRGIADPFDQHAEIAQEPLLAGVDMEEGWQGQHRRAAQFDSVTAQRHGLFQRTQPRARHQPLGRGSARRDQSLERLHPLAQGVARCLGGGAERREIMRPRFKTGARVFVIEVLRDGEIVVEGREKRDDDAANACCHGAPFLPVSASGLEEVAQRLGALPVARSV